MDVDDEGVDGEEEEEDDEFGDEFVVIHLNPSIFHIATRLIINYTSSGILMTRMYLGKSEELQPSSFRL